MDELVYRCIIIAASIILMAKPSYSQWVIVPSQTAREEKNNKDDNIDNAQYDTSDRNRRYRWLTKPDDKFSYVKGTFALIPIYKDSEYAYKYYFDDKGYLITDNISNDWTVLDMCGREIDSELNPIKYKIITDKISVDAVAESTADNTSHTKRDIYYNRAHNELISSRSQLIVMEGVVFKKKLEKIFNTLIEKDMQKHIVGGVGFQKDATGTIFTKAKIKNALKINGDGKYVIFENKANNFNKISGKIAIESVIGSDRQTKCMIAVFNKEDFDVSKFDEPIYEIDSFNYTEPTQFLFTFDRTIKNIVFVLSVEGKYTNRTVYMKDLRFGFSKSAYLEELRRKHDNEDEIEQLQSLDLYTEEDSYFELIDEEGNLLEEVDIEEDGFIDHFDSEEEYNDLIDKNSGPQFDISLGQIKEINNGPYFYNAATISDTKSKRNRKSSVIWPK